MENKIITTADGRALDVNIYNPQGEHSILFFHGFGASASSVHPDESLLKYYNYALIALNRPGVGQSTVVKNYSAADVAQDAATALNALDRTTCTVAGWSAGGVYALQFALSYPRRTTALHLISSAFPFAHKEAVNALPQRWKSIRLLNKYLPWCSRLLFQKMQKALQKNSAKVLAQSVAQMVEADKAVTCHPLFTDLLKKAAAEGFANGGLGVHYDARALCRTALPLEQITIPTHIWQGAEDNIWPLATAEHLQRCIPGAQLHVTHDAGHLLHLAQWEKIVRQIAVTTVNKCLAGC